MDQNKRLYVVEHMEEFLYEWSKLEYFQILKYLEPHQNAQFILSNFNKIKNFKSDNKQDEETNQKQLADLLDNEESKKIIFLDDPIHSYYDGECFKINNQKIKKVCLLDLRGKDILKPSNSEDFDMVIIGGILGDHPPRDRTSSLRQNNVEMKHLGNLQLATDTAVLVTKIILENQIPFEEIPFIDEPEIIGNTEDGMETAVQMEGFRYKKFYFHNIQRRYVSALYNVTTGKFENNEILKDQPLIIPQIKDKLLFEEFDLNNFVFT